VYVLGSIRDSDTGRHKMSGNYPAGSMMGSGIYSVEVPYGEFTCENEECGEHNEAGESATDDYGNYEVVCEACGVQYLESSLSQDKQDYLEANYEDWDR
jgi:hypothetical protein